ncbi:hypothetical protein LINPERHAP1_LOCUS34983, partial [Linum perenne]
SQELKFRIRIRSVIRRRFKERLDWDALVAVSHRVSGMDVQIAGDGCRSLLADFAHPYPRRLLLAVDPPVALEAEIRRIGAAEGCGGGCLAAVTAFRRRNAPYSADCGGGCRHGCGIEGLNFSTH